MRTSFSSGLEYFTGTGAELIAAGVVTADQLPSFTAPDGSALRMTGDVFFYCGKPAGPRRRIDFEPDAENWMRIRIFVGGNYQVAKGIPRERRLENRRKVVEENKARNAEWRQRHEKAARLADQVRAHAAQASARAERTTSTPHARQSAAPVRHTAEDVRTRLQADIDRVLMVMHQGGVDTPFPHQQDGFGMGPLAHALMEMNAKASQRPEEVERSSKLYRAIDDLELARSVLRDVIYDLRVMSGWTQED